MCLFIYALNIQVSLWIFVATSWWNLQLGRGFATFGRCRNNGRGSGGWRTSANWCLDREPWVAETGAFVDHWSEGSRVGWHAMYAWYTTNGGVCHITPSLTVTCCYPLGFSSEKKGWLRWPLSPCKEWDVQWINDDNFAFNDVKADELPVKFEMALV